MKHAMEHQVSQMATAGLTRAASVCPIAYPWSVAVDTNAIGGFGDHKHLTTRRPKEASR